MIKTDMLTCPERSDIKCSGARVGRGCCCVTPDKPIGFEVFPRDDHHWDVSTQYGRAFRIRGLPGEVIVFDERKFSATSPRAPHRNRLAFATIKEALAFCAGELMMLDGHLGGLA